MSTKILLLFFSFLSISLFAQHPAQYDARTFGYVTSVKNQGSCGACWAFASCAAIESAWLRQGGTAVDLSEDLLIDCHGFDETPCVGGSFYMTQALLSRHQGTTAEAADPYTPSTPNCSYGGIFPPAALAHVEEMLFIPANQNDIKTAVMNYGAVASSMFFTSSNYNSTTFKYYDAAIGSLDSLNAHCVTIVGWDDNMTFPGAPANGGWIIKDSYGTTWANNGYFYCSYYDAGILSENVVFPSKQAIPPSANNDYVYAHDYFGWVDNYGFSANTGYALAKYIIAPMGGNTGPQQIKRIGTYAVEDNMVIDMEVYSTKNGNVLSGLLASKQINCTYKGFYTTTIHMPSLPISTAVYIKVKYLANSGGLLPIPIETFEQNHTSGFVASNNSCWISPMGNMWTAVGQNTAYNFDACIKMYTENAPMAAMENVSDTACQNTPIIINDWTAQPVDSVQWFVNGNYKMGQPNLNYISSQTGPLTINLVAHLGQNSDTASQSLMVYNEPATPSISQNGSQLMSSTALAYQWLDEFFQPIMGETNQTFTPPIAGDYYVQVFNQYGCMAISAPFNFVTALDYLEQSSLRLYPNPANEVLLVEAEDSLWQVVKEITVYNSLGQLQQSIAIDNIQLQKAINISHLSAGWYYIGLRTHEGEIIGKKFYKN